MLFCRGNSCPYEIVSIYPKAETGLDAIINKIESTGYVRFNLPEGRDWFRCGVNCECDKGQFIVSIYPKAETGLDELTILFQGGPSPDVSIYPKAETGLDGK